MKQLLAAGLLYLVGVATILILKPSFMFSADGTWKEFGIGRNPATHTWMPFWLFAILWALISYIVTILLFAIYKVKPANTYENLLAKQSDGSPASPLMPNASDKPVNVINTSDMDEETAESIMESILKATKRKARARGKPTELPEGYYVMNTDATEAAGGIPKYVYIGKALPDES